VTKNESMKVRVGDLERRLAESLERIEQGDVVLLTDGDAVVAELRPPVGDPERMVLDSPRRGWTWKPRRCSVN